MNSLGDPRTREAAKAYSHKGVLLDYLKIWVSEHSSFPKGKNNIFGVGEVDFEQLDKSR
jgi:hypothetical protein